MQYEPVYFSLSRRDGNGVVTARVFRDREGQEQVREEQFQVGQGDQTGTVLYTLSTRGLEINRYRNARDPYQQLARRTVPWSGGALTALRQAFPGNVVFFPQGGTLFPTDGGNCQEWAQYNRSEVQTYPSGLQFCGAQLQANQRRSGYRGSKKPPCDTPERMASGHVHHIVYGANPLRAEACAKSGWGLTTGWDRRPSVRDRYILIAIQTHDTDQDRQLARTELIDAINAAVPVEFRVVPNQIEYHRIAAERTMYVIKVTPRQQATFVAYSAAITLNLNNRENDPLIGI